MNDLLLVNADGPERRVALVENGLLAELHIERSRDRRIVGNIYMGRVARVLPGMQAAFVDIGIGKAAFLYADDVLRLSEDNEPTHRSTDHSNATDPTADLPRGKPLAGPPIQQQLAEGDEIIVQVAKEPIGSKGARVTSYISLPGRTLVFMPTLDHVGISRRITDDAERSRLRDIVESIRPAGSGLIVRTVAEQQGDDVLRADMDFLVKLWGEISARIAVAKAPCLVHQDLDLTLRAVRDLVSGRVSKLIVDDLAEYEKLRDFIATFMPHHADILQLYQASEPLFDAHGIEHEIDRALDRKVWLKSGGYLVIDESEALTAIDVNTGRYVGQRTLEDTITKINIEAVKEVVNQLRLRNIGGLIIVDFIDMELESNRQKVWRALHDALQADRAKTNVLEISQLGLVEMTRQRVRDSLMHQLAGPCPYCEGRGFVKTPATICNEVLREIRRQASNMPGKTIAVRVHPDVGDLLADAESERLGQLERRLGREIVLEQQPNFHLERYEIRVSVRDTGR